MGAGGWLTVRKGEGVSRGGDGALRPGQGMAWLAQESTGCEGRGRECGRGNAVMQEGACGRRAVAPVKIDPPHSFPTFSPREVCYHRERERMRRGGGRDGWRRRDAGEWGDGGGCEGGSRGGYLPSCLSLCIHISGSSRAFSCAYVCMHHVNARSRARAFSLSVSLSRRWQAGGRASGQGDGGRTWTDTRYGRVRV